MQKELGNSGVRKSLLMPEGTYNLRIGSAASRNGILKGLKSWVQVGDGMGRKQGRL